MSSGSSARGSGSRGKESRRPITVNSAGDLDDGKDKKVGFVQIYTLEQETVPEPSNDPPTLSGSRLGIGLGHHGSFKPNHDLAQASKIPKMITRQSKKGTVQRCYVYACRAFEDEPYYYLTKVNTRVFVLDKKRIEFFPNGVEPAELRGSIADYSRVEENPEAEGAFATFQREPATKIGFTMVQTVRGNNKPVEEGEEAEAGAAVAAPVWEKRDVFVSDGGFVTEPFYYSDSGNRIIVVDKKKIYYLLPDGTEPTIPPPKKPAMRFFTSHYTL